MLTWDDVSIFLNQQSFFYMADEVCFHCADCGSKFFEQSACQNQQTGALMCILCDSINLSCYICPEFDEDD